MRAHCALCGQRFRQCGQFGSGKWVVLQTGLLRGGQGGRAFLRLQRANRIDHPAAGPQHRGGGGDQGVLLLRESGDVLLALEVRDVGVAADGARGAARRVEQHGVQRNGGTPTGRVGGHDSGGELQALQVFLQAHGSLRMAFDREHVCAGAGQLGSLAAGRRAQIGDVLASFGVEQAGRECRGGVLHPERAFVISGQIGHAGAGGIANGPAGKPLPTRGRLAAHGEVKRSFAGMGGGDGAGVAAPARPKPGGRVKPGTVQLGKGGLALFRDAAEHGIDQAGEGGEGAAAGESDACGDSGMGRRVEQQELGRAEAQHLADGVGRGAAQEGFQYRVERPGAAQHGGGEPMGRGTVARFGYREGVQRLLQCLAPDQHGGQQIKRAFAGGIRPCGISSRVGHGWHEQGVHGVDWGCVLERAGMNLLDTRRPRALLLAFCLLVWLPGLFTLPPTDRDESRFAQASKQMIESGDYVRIMNGTVPRNAKPIGIYWLQVPFAAAARSLHLATENPIWPYRLPSLAGGLLAVLATYEIGRAMGDRRAAVLAAAMLGACVILVVETHLAKTDAMLLGVTTVAMSMLARAYAGDRLGRAHAALFWLMMGVGILLKGPITPMVAGLAALTLAGLDQRARWLLALRPVSGLVIVLLVVLPWFVAIELATHGAFADDSVGGDLARKLSSGDDAHGGPPGLHLLLMPLLAFPATLPVLLSLPSWWRSRRERATRFLLAWVVPSWIVFEAAPTKLPHYTLPLYPAIFLLAARYVTAGTPVREGWWQRRGAPGLTLLAAAVLGLGGFALPPAIGAPAWLGIPTLLAAGLIGYLAMSPGQPGLALAAMPLLTLALLGWELPNASRLWLAPRVEQALVTAGLAERPLSAVGFHEPSLVFLTGTNTVLSPSGADGAQALASGQVGAAAVSSRDLASFQDEAAKLNLHLHGFATIRGFNYSRGRDTTLTLFDAAGAGAESRVRASAP